MLKDPEVSKPFITAINNYVELIDSQLGSSGTDIGDGIDSNNEAMQRAINERRKSSVRSNKPRWKKSEAALHKALCSRNHAHSSWLLSPTDSNRTIYKNLAASFQKIVDKAKRDERQGIEKTVNEFFEKKVKGATHLISAKKTGGH